MIRFLKMPFRKPTVEPPKPPPPQPPLEFPKFHEIGMAEWRSDRGRVQYVHDLLRTPEFRELFAVLQNSLLRTLGERGAGSAEFNWGFTIGYQKCLDNLLLAARQVPRKPEAIEATYSDNIVKEMGVS